MRALLTEAARRPASSRRDATPPGRETASRRPLPRDQHPVDLVTTGNSCMARVLALSIIVAFDAGFQVSTGAPSG